MATTAVAQIVIPYGYKATSIYLSTIGTISGGYTVYVMEVGTESPTDTLYVADTGDWDQENLLNGSTGWYEPVGTKRYIHIKANGEVTIMGGYITIEKI